MKLFFGLLLLAVFSVAPAKAQTATFISSDIETQGSWQGKYGADGYTIEAGAQSLPSYAQVIPSGSNTYTWAASTTDPRALQNGGSRIASTWYSDTTFYVDLNIVSGTHQVCFYALDWDTFEGGRNETLQITNTATPPAILTSQPISSFTNGVYVCLNISGHVRVNFLNNLSTSNVTLSGMFFDPVASTLGAVPAVLMSIQTPGNNSSVQSATTNGTFAVTVNMGSGSAPAHAVNLLWTPSTSSFVTGYNVYRSQTNGGPYSKITGTPIPGLSYVDANVTAGQIYYYVLTMLSGTAESVFSNQVTVQVPTP